MTAPVEGTSRESLAREIASLRRQLGLPDGPPAAVSGRNFDAVLELSAELGLSSAQLAEGLALDLDGCRRPDAWLPWDDFNALLDRIQKLRGEDGLRQLGRLALRSPLFRAVGVIAGTLVSVEHLLSWVGQRVFDEDGLYFRGLHAHVERSRPGVLRVRFEAHRQAWACEPLALVLAGIVEALPALIGARTHAMDVVEWDQDEITLELTYEERRSASGYLRGLIGTDPSEELRQLYLELAATNHQLERELAALEASRRARAELEAGLEERRRAELLGRFAANVRHELNNLLTVMINQARVIGDAIPPDHDARPDLAALTDAASRSVGLLQRLRGIDGQAPPAPAETVDLGATVEAFAPLLGRLSPAQVELRLDLVDAPLPVLVDVACVEEVLTNLFLNACEAMPHGGEVCVRTGRLDAEGAACLCVSDGGVGMDAATAARIFEPFFTTKPAGHGVGLAAVRALVEGTDGSIGVATELGQGTELRVLWPLSVGAEEQSSAPLQPIHRPEAEPRTVLLIEDDDVVRRVTERMVRSGGYVVHAAGSGREALESIDRGLTPDVILSDIVMPGMRGPSAVAAIREVLGPVPVLFVSGNPDGDLPPLDERTRYLDKPYSPDELLLQLAALLAAEPAE